jgi:hypothetical protein
LLLIELAILLWWFFIRIARGAFLLALAEIGGIGQGYLKEHSDWAIPGQAELRIGVSFPKLLTA